MSASFFDRLSPVLSLMIVLVCASIHAQQASAPHTLASGVERLAGTETSSHIQYARLILKGSPRASAHGASDPPSSDPPPILIAQCSLRPNGKYIFEMFTSFGGPADLAFYPPWKPATPQDLYPPRTAKVTITMDFLGYTHVKPFRRQWEIPVETPSLYRYNPPGAASSNLEEISWFLRYLLSLPTLRLTLDNRATEFVTTQFLADVHNEPLCKAAGL